MPWTFRVHRLYARWHSEGMGRGCSSLPLSSLEGSSGHTTGASQNHYCPSRDPTLASAGTPALRGGEDGGTSVCVSAFFAAGLVLR